jgi:hypothetical protein
MTGYEPLDPILVKADAYTKRWFQLPSDLRHRIEERAPFLASRGAPTSKAIAIVGNSTPTAWGAWQYSRDDGASWADLPGAELGDERAIILIWPAKFRFMAAKNWFGSPSHLTARLWLSPGGIRASGERDISASIGDKGPWSAELLELAEARSRPEGVFPATQWATGAGWDALSPEGRRTQVQQGDSCHDPAFAEQRQAILDLVGEIGELEREEANWQRMDTGHRPSEELLKRDELARLRQTREAKELELKRLVDGSVTADAGKATGEPPGVAQIRAVVAAIQADGKQLKRSAFDKMVDKLASLPRGQKTKGRSTLWREIAPDGWRTEGQGTPGKGATMIENWEAYLPSR